MASISDFNQASSYKANAAPALVEMAKALKILMLIISSNAPWQSGNTPLPELKEIFKDEPMSPHRNHQCL
ncbi:MAG: hypothetical protein ACR5K7_05265 [Symbiopectobacterium sp.]